MNCGHVFGSISAWRKLADVKIKPKLGYQILKYTKEVSTEFEIIEKQKNAMVHEITGTEPGQAVTIEPNSDTMRLYAERITEILSVETSLKPINLKFSDVIDSLDENNEALTVSDLSVLEPFFECPNDCPCE